jgi:OOP family OmpA-OmpF porin
MKLASTGLALALALACGGAAAQTGLYVIGGLGQGKAKFDSSDFPGAAGAEEFLEEEAGVAPGTFAGLVSRSDDTSDMTWNIGIGYRFHRNFAAEAGYAHLGDYNVRYSGNGAAAGLSDNSDYKVTALKLAAVGFLPVADRFSVLAKLGFARTTAENDFTIVAGGTDSGTLKENKNRVFWGIGAQYDFSPKMGVRIEYEDYGKVGASFSGNTGNEPGEAKISTFNANLIFSF